jgi:hypothetical protein
MEEGKKEKRIFNNVNVLGNIHLDDPENIPERSYLTGPGTDRPVSFTQSQFARLFWRHRMFRCSAFGFLPLDLLAAFLVGGGATGTIVGSLTGLALASMINGIAVFSANTQVFVAGRSKIRVTVPGINNGITQGKAEQIGGSDTARFLAWLGLGANQQLKLDDKIKPNILSSFRNDVNEGSTSIGSNHFATSGGGFLSIDFRDTIVTRGGQYWPRIILMFGPSAGNNGPAFSSVLRITSLDGRPENDLVQGGPWNVQTIGGVIFDGAVIQMFGNSNYNWLTSIGIVNGDIVLDTSNPCSTMNWDTFEDSARDGYKKEECKKVFRENRSSSSSSP